MCCCERKLYRRAAWGSLLSFLVIGLLDCQNVHQTLGGAVDCHQKQRLSSVANFRDLADAGMTTSSGKTLKPGLFYRSSRLYTSSIKEQNLLFQDLDINFVADFRSNDEAWWAPDPISSSRKMTDYHLYNISDSSTKELQWDLLSGRMNSTHMSNIMEELNVKFAVQHQSFFAQFLRDILSPNHVPFLIHCTAGKDRTGWATALILRLLGFTEVDIVEDFMASNCGYDPTARKNAVLLRLFSLFRVKVDTMESLLRVRESYIRSGFEAVIEKYGDWETYVELGLGMDYVKLTGELQALLLE